MRQRQDEVFSVVVENPEGQFIVMILTINRVELHVVGVMHPAEVPLVPEAQTAHILRTRNAVEIGRLSAIVTAPETCSPRIRLVLRKNSIASRFSRPPNSFGIHSPLYGCSRDKSLTPPHDAQRINTKTFNPVKRVTDEEVTDFTATIVVDQRVPVLMIAFTRIAVFIQVRAIKFGKRKVIGREVARTQSRITFRPAACAASMK